MRPSGQSALSGYISYLYVKPHLKSIVMTWGFVNTVFKLQLYYDYSSYKMISHNENTQSINYLFYPS